MLDAFASLRAAVRDLVSTVLATPPFPFLRVVADWLAARLPAPMPPDSLPDPLLLTPTTPPALRDDTKTAARLSWLANCDAPTDDDVRFIRAAAREYGVTVSVTLPAPLDGAPDAIYRRDWPARVGVYPGGFANVEPIFPAGCCVVSIVFLWSMIAHAILTGRSIRF